MYGEQERVRGVGPVSTQRQDALVVGATAAQGQAAQRECARLFRQQASLSSCRSAGRNADAGAGTVSNATPACTSIDGGTPQSARVTGLWRVDDPADEHAPGNASHESDGAGHV